VITFEFENVPAETLETLAARARVAPGVTSLATSQDRVAEKRFFERCDIPVQRFAAVETVEDLARACGTVGCPGVLKTRRLGYDGRGQVVVRSPAEAPAAWRAVGGVPCIYEEFVPFTHEVSAIAARDARGAVAHYPLARNVHAGGILRTTIAPGEPACIERALEALDHVGVLAIEFFATPAGLVANEMAPRVHNTGHWTQQGAVTSQFENHIRAITGAPLGCGDARGACGMVNLIGGMPAPEEVLAVPGAALHLYGKRARRGRKIGHVNVCAPSTAVRDATMRVLTALVAPTTDA
jgi:5-(carboxyamino)imidazole ribonucleotide synthase